MTRPIRIIFLALVTFFASLTFPQSAQAAAGTVGSGSCTSSVTETANVVNISTGGKCIFKFTTGTTTFTFPAAVSSIDFLVIGGGGQGGTGRGGGGGAGSMIEGFINSPALSYSITVGAGGSGSANSPAGTDGGSSSIGSVVIASGGGGGGGHSTSQNGRNGGSGGGAGMNYSTASFAGGLASSGTVPSFSTGYVNIGAASSSDNSSDTYRLTGGGGGAGRAGYAGACVGLAASSCTNKGAGGTAPDGGTGLASSITGSSVVYAAGGGGAIGIALSEYNGSYKSAAPGVGGSGIGGNGTGFTAGGAYTTPTAGAANTGSGGGGAGTDQTGGAGGSGVVIISYVAPLPTYTSISVNSGSTAGGTSTVITGTNLTSTTSVTVGGATATLETITATTLAIKTPAGTVGAKNIIITNPSGSVTATSVFTYVVPPVLTGTTQSLLATSGKVAYDTVTATSSNTPITFTLTGNGPAGITIDTRTVNTAVLTVGISTTSGVYTETVTATDASSISSTFVITVTVAQSITLTPFSASVTKTYGIIATDTITATLGTGNKTLTLTNLTGESNITIDTSTANTAILRVGAAATTGTYAVTINAVDSVSATASLSITINVSAASAITITAATPSAFTYSPTGISLTNSYTASGLLAGDTVTAITYQYGVDTATTSATIPTNAGTYYIVPSAVTLTDSHQGNYATINYISGILTINRAEDSGFLNYSTAEAVVGNSYTLYVAGGSGTGSVTYLVTGGTASGCSITGSILIATSAGTCIVQFTKAQSTNYNAKSSSVIITFRTYEILTTASIPSDGSGHGIVISGGGTPWSKNATASPTITSFTPSSGPVGTTITITGTGLNGVTVVRLNFEDMATVIGVSPTSVTAVVQSGATSGPIYIENSYGADFNFDGFTVTTP